MPWKEPLLTVGRKIINPKGPYYFSPFSVCRLVWYTSGISRNRASGPQTDDEPAPEYKRSHQPGALQWLTMRENVASAIFEKHLSKAAGSLLLLASLTFLVGCQGLSAGGSGQEQASTLSLSLVTSTLDFGSVAAGSSKTLTITATNSGPDSVTISSAAISTQYFALVSPSLPVSVAAGQSATISIVFTPNAAGAFNATLSINSNASNSVMNISLTGIATGISAGQLTLNPAGDDFGNVIVGSNKSLSERVTNTGGSSVTISQVSVSGTGFSFSGINTPVTLTAGQSTTFSVTFTPASATSASGNVSVISNASNPTLTIPLSGTGTATAGQLTVNPTTLNLGSVVVGNSGTASGSLTVNGATVIVTAASSNNSVFSVGGLSLPATIPAGQSAPFTVSFSPQVAGAVNALLTFTSYAHPSTTVQNLAGTGTAAPNHTVNLSWNSSTSSDVTGYNIYRAVFRTSCGSYSKINSVLDTSTVYTDASVVNGTSYCYASTAVNSSGEESGYSNIVSNVQIPTL